MALVPQLTIRPGNPDFLDLPWERPLAEWDDPRVVDLPKGISRHEVRFLRFPEGIYAVKELPLAPARQDYHVLRELETRAAPAVTPVGLVEHRHPDPGSERSAALITRYVEYAFSYRELLEGAGFGTHRAQMLDAFAGLLVELHLAGCFWGDCSLSNVLYRWDAYALETLMVDAETAEIHDELTDGQREADLEIMVVNVAGGMADIAAAAGRDLDEADLGLGEEIADRYRTLWAELTREVVIGREERYRIEERIARLNELGFNVEEVDLEPVAGGDRLRLRVRVGARNFHASRLRELTGIEAGEWQARQLLSDLFYHAAKEGTMESPSGKALAAIRWRVSVFEPMIERLRSLDGVADPIQAYCDILHVRYLRSVEAGHDIGTEAAFEAWLAEGRPSSAETAPPTLPPA